jgi:homospermidine synthase
MRDRHFRGRVVLLGLSGLGRGVLPLLARHLPRCLVVVTSLAPGQPDKVPPH